MSDWITANASVTGVSHHKTGIPCQDASIVRVDSSGEWIVAVVSDGAGTARRAEEGSSLIVDIFSKSSGTCQIPFSLFHAICSRIFKANSLIGS